MYMYIYICIHIYIYNIYIHIYIYRTSTPYISQKPKNPKYRRNMSFFHRTSISFIAGCSKFHVDTVPNVKTISLQAYLSIYEEILFHSFRYVRRYIIYIIIITIGIISAIIIF